MKKTKKSHTNFSLNNLILVLIILLSLTLRIVYLGKMNLYTDESYYWNWSRNLAFGYFSHPPMVAWLIKISTFLFGNSESAIRFPFAILGTLTVITYYLLAKLFINRHAALATALVIATSPAYIFASRLALPDQPIILFWALTMFFFWKAYKQNKLSDFILFGLFSGLGLLTKYQMFFLPFSIAFFIITNKKAKPILKNLKLYLAVTISFLFFLPNLYWNFSHNWVTFAFQSLNGKIQSFPKGFSLEHFFSNIFTFSSNLINFHDPFIKFCLILPLITFVFIGVKRKKEEISYLFYSFFFTTAFFSVFSGGQHWAMPALIGANLLTVYLFFHLFGKTKLFYMVIFSVCSINLINSVMQIKTFSATKIFPSVFTIPLYHEIFNNSYKWKEDALIIANKFDFPNNKQVFISEDYRIASELAYYLPDQPKTYAVHGQYLLWGPPKNWQNTTIISLDKKLFTDQKPQKFRTTRREFYFLETNNPNIKLSKDWSIHFELP